MSTRATVILFSILFAIGIAVFVVLPLVFRIEPEEPEPDQQPGMPTALPPERGFFRSDDGGRTWQSKSVQSGGGSVADFRVNRLIADPVRTGLLFLATNANGLWFSRDRGESWSQIKDASGALEPTANVSSLAINPANTQTWYVAAFQQNRGRVFKTIDGGQNFRQIYATPIDRFGVFDVMYDSVSGTVGIATGQGGYLESLDKGGTWRVVRWFADGLTRLLMPSSGSPLRFAASAKGRLFRSLDEGGTWADATPAFRSRSGATENQRWFMDQRGALYLGSGYGLLRSRDNGETFEAPPVLIPPEALPVLAGAVDPRNASRVMISADGQMFASEDDGQSWALVPAPGKGRIMHLLIDSERSRTVYAWVEQ